MPTYEYVCKECGEQLEAVQAFSDPPLTTCAACGGPLRKVFGNVGIVFKGSGFYKTDSRAGANGSKGSKGPAAASGTPDGGGEKSEGGSSSTKEAASTGSGSTGSTGSSNGSSPSAPATSTASGS